MFDEKEFLNEKKHSIEKYMKLRTNKLAQFRDNPFLKLKITI